MKKLILTFGIVLAGLFTVQAQDKAEQKADKIVAEYTNVAQITPDQSAKIKPMIESFLETQKANKAKYAEDKEGMKTATKTNRENLRTQLKTVLSAEQIQKIEDYNKAKKERSKEKNGASNQE